MRFNYVLASRRRHISLRIPRRAIESAQFAAIRKSLPRLLQLGMSADYRAVLKEFSGGDGFHADFFRRIFDGRKFDHQNGRRVRECGARALRGVCAICPAMDLASCADALE